MMAAVLQITRFPCDKRQSPEVRLQNGTFAKVLHLAESSTNQQKGTAYDYRIMFEMDAERSPAVLIRLRRRANSSRHNIHDVLDRIFPCYQRRFRLAPEPPTVLTNVFAALRSKNGLRSTTHWIPGVVNP